MRTTQDDAVFKLRRCECCNGVSLTLETEDTLYEVCLHNDEAVDLATGLMKIAGANFAEAVALETMIPQGHA